MRKKGGVLLLFGTSFSFLSFSKKEVLAFYYPWYGTKAYSGEWIHWGQARPTKQNKKKALLPLFPEENAEHDPDRIINGFPDIASTHHPLQLYDSADPNVQRAHIQIAREIGIDGFIVSWWGKGDRTDTIFASLLQEAEKQGFLIAPYFEETLSNEKTVEELLYLLRKYAGAKSFLHWEGKPVIFFYSRAVFSKTYSDWKKILTKTKKQADFIASADTHNTRFVMPAILRLFDGIHLYNPVLEVQSKQDMKKNYKEYVALGRKKKKKVCVTVIPGYDDSHIGRPSPIVVERREGALYQTLWEAAIASQPDCVLITSFNEWHEGTEIEESYEHGKKYLELTKKFSSIFKKN